MNLWKTGSQRTTIIVKGEGNYVYDNNGDRYLDLQSGYWCNVFGYGNSEYGEHVQGELINRGFLMDYHKSSNSFRFFPPFTIKKQEIDDFIIAFKETLLVEIQTSTGEPSESG